MKQPTLSRTRRVSAATHNLLSNARGGSDSDFKSRAGVYAERMAFDTRSTAVAPPRNISVDVPYGGTITVTPEGKGTYTPA